MFPVPAVGLQLAPCPHSQCETYAVSKGYILRCPGLEPGTPAGLGAPTSTTPGPAGKSPGSGRHLLSPLSPPMPPPLAPGKKFKLKFLEQVGTVGRGAEGSTPGRTKPRPQGTGGAVSWVWEQSRLGPTSCWVIAFSCAPGAGVGGGGEGVFARRGSHGACTQLNRDCTLVIQDAPK